MRALGNLVDKWKSGSGSRRKTLEYPTGGLMIVMYPLPFHILLPKNTVNMIRIRIG